MEATKWTEIATIGVAVVAALVAAVSPYITWKLGRRGQKEDAKRQVRLNVFSAVMENRHSSESFEAIRALNIIDVAYHDSPNVRRIWREYYDMINSGAFFQDEIGFQLRNQKLQDLLTEMARSLDFGVDRFDVARIYAPKWLTDEERLRALDRHNRLQALARTRAIPSEASDPPSQVIAGGSFSKIEPAVYLTKYFGQNGTEAGVGVLAIGNSEISGTDISGGSYTGTYEIKDGRLFGEVSLYASAKTSLVTGMFVDKDTVIQIKINIPSVFDDGNMHNIDVGGETVRVKFERVNLAH